MATTDTSSAGLAGHYQKKFQKQLLQHAIQELRLAEFGKTPTVLGKNEGSKQVAWLRRVAASAANVQDLVEGVAPTNTTEITYTEVNATLEQIGEVAKITDILNWTALYSVMKDGVALLGEDCALKADTVIRNAIIAGVTTAGQKRYAMGTPGTPITDFTSLSAATQAEGKLTAPDVLNAVTRLKINRARKIGGYYVGVIPPQTSRDLMDDDDWLKSAEYSDVEKLYKGELGRIHGVRFVEATNPFIEDETEGTYDATDNNTDGLIYSTIITGAEAYGVANLAGQGPMKPQIIICDKADKTDPLNQFITVGWKAFYVAKTLNENFMVVLRSKSTFTS